MTAKGGLLLALALLGAAPALAGTTSLLMLDQFTAWLAMQGFLKTIEANPK